MNLRLEEGQLLCHQPAAVGALSCHVSNKRHVLTDQVGFFPEYHEHLRSSLVWGSCATTHIRQNRL